MRGVALRLSRLAVPHNLEPGIAIMSELRTGVATILYYMMLLLMPLNSVGLTMRETERERERESYLLVT